MHWYGKSDIGKNRTDNQDCLVMRQIGSDYALFAVCDGVGGARGGAVASSLISGIFADSVADRITERIRSKNSSILAVLSESAIREILLRSLETAKEALIQKAAEDSTLAAMSTTLVALLLSRSFAYILNIGDSRAYLHTSDSLTLLTKDHSFVQELVDSGVITSDQATDHAYKNYITRSVGISTDSTPDLYKVSLADLSDPVFLLCSDGLTNMLSDTEIGKILSGGGSLRYKGERLIHKANRVGGLDNITVLLVSGKI